MQVGRSGLAAPPAPSRVAPAAEARASDDGVHDTPSEEEEDRDHEDAVQHLAELEARRQPLVQDREHAAPITGPSSVPRPPNATSTRTRTSTRSKLYVAGLMKPAL